MIGIIQLTLDTPYTRLMKYYSNLDFDVIGVYYEQEGTLTTVFYDIYSSQRLPTQVTIGDFFYWKHLLHCESERYEVNEQTEEVVISSLLLTTLNCEESLTHLIESGHSLILDRFRSHDLNGRHYESTRFEPVFRGDVPRLDSFYCNLHSILFELLRERNLAGAELFPGSVSTKKPKKSLEKKFRSALEAKTAVLRLSRDECDLGECSFRRSVILEYNPEESSFEFTSDNATLRLVDTRCDLRLLDVRNLRDLLRYFETLPSESYATLRKCLLEELLEREQK